MATLTEREAQTTHDLLEGVLYELKKVIVGQEHLLERLLVALISHGHVLVEGPPGLAKTLTLKTLAQVLSLEFKRIQFTPDLLPSDLLGTRIYHPSKGEFSTEKGPVFTHFLLADEINRAPAKVQSALLEAMQEQQVTIGLETYELHPPFLVMATQNPIETEGTYPLPEAQVDRFLLKLLVDYPDSLEEMVILQRMTGNQLPVAENLVSRQQIMDMAEQSRSVYLDPKLMQYIVDLVQATREPGDPELKSFIEYGASPRGGLALANTSKSLALLRGRSYVTIEDIEALVHDCLRHRIILTYEGLVAGMTADTLLARIEKRVSKPVLTGV